MRKSFQIIISSIVMAAVLTGCATMVNGTSQAVCFRSEPSNAKVYVNSYDIGATPTSVILSRKCSHHVRIELEGYEPFDTVLSPTPSAWVLGNFVFGGLVGLGVDVVTGAMYRLTPNEITTTLAKAEEENSSELLTVRLVNEVDPSWEKIGQLESK